MQRALERRLARLPEVERVFSRIGTADVANDPMPPSLADTFVMMKPRSAWPDARKPKAQLLEEIEGAARSLPGSNYEFTQPIQMRMNELLSGVRADVAIRINGDDLDTLNRIAARVAAIAKKVPGAADVRVEDTAGLPMLVVTPDRPALSRYASTRRMCSVRWGPQLAVRSQVSSLKVTGAPTSLCDCRRTFGRTRTGLLICPSLTRVIPMTTRYPEVQTGPRRAQLRTLAGSGPDRGS